MASSPFEVDDQTDEDFFDKLVNDDDELDYSGSSHTHGDVSDEAKAFSNLSISEVGPNGEESGGSDTGFNIEEAEEGGQDDSGMGSLDSREAKLVAKESNLVIPGNVNESSEMGIGAKESNAVIPSNANESIETNAVIIPNNVNETSEVGIVEEIGTVHTSSVASGTIESNAVVIPSNVNEPSEVGIVEETGTVHTSSVASGTGVKEVQWTSFNSSDSDVHQGIRFGSYSDLFNELGDNSEDPFADVVNKVDTEAEHNVIGGVSGNSVADLSSTSYSQNHDFCHGVGSEQIADGQDLSSTPYWENLYPGWRYDPNTAQWYQLDGYDANANVTATVDTNVTVNANVNTQENFDVKAQSVTDGVVSDRNSYVNYLQQTAQSVVGSVAEGCTNASVSNWNSILQGNTEYPAHMVFDPQYPGWYYDTIAQEWRSLESYTSAMNLSTIIDYSQQYQIKNIETHGDQGLGSQDHIMNWGGVSSSYKLQTTNTWQAQPVLNREATGFLENKQLGHPYGSTGHVDNSAEQQIRSEPSGSVAAYEQASQSTDWSDGVSGSQGFVSTEKFHQRYNQNKLEPSLPMHFKPAYFDSQKSASFPEHLLQTSTQFSYAPSEGRSSAGRPPHTLVTFGFGGKIVVLENNSSFQTNSVYGSQDSAGRMINVLNLVEVVMGKTDTSTCALGVSDYFHALCQQSFPGPLVGGNVGNKEINKWIDERVASCESLNMNDRKAEVLRLFFSLLKIACQYYGKLRSPFGADQALKESDCPESAVAKLFASANGSREDGALTHCLQNLPSDAQIQATALEVQKLLVSGRKKEALECAQEGQLWGLALVLASQLGDQFYVDTVKQMALKQLVAGSPLRTLCLLIARQPADVFSNATSNSSFSGYVNSSQQPVQIAANSMLDEWEDNLAIITANRTKDDECVIIHLSDCLWKERGEVIAAHIGYLVAEANLEPYSDSARLCLLGADHWKFPRTYASPEAIQRTELYEYSKVLGNSQFLLLPFQPYKLIYAYMLAEVGKVSESLKYCQAILKSLKTGRLPEIETWRQLVVSLEERLRTHQQGGYSTNLAPTKLVGKLLTFFDSTAQRVVGGLPPPVPSASHSSAHHNEFANQAGGLPPPVPSASRSSAQHNDFFSQPGGPKVSGSQSTMEMSSLMPSVSVEPISGRTGETSQMVMHNRSISEPDFGRTPVQVDSSKEVNSSDAQEKASVSGGYSRFGRFGSQLFQKTVGLVLRSRTDRQAKLGERNKFYYDEKLKRWVEEGAEPPAEETALLPPPTAAFMGGMPDKNANVASKNENFHSNSGSENKSPVSSERSSGFPPISPSSNQFSAHGRMSVRSRYVDTFNKGGGTPTNLFQAPFVSPAKPPGSASNPKFFIPTPVAPGEETVETTGGSKQETVVTNENPPISVKENSSLSSPASTSSLPMTMQRHPSVDNIMHERTGAVADDNNSLPPHSRRTASWGGSVSDACSPSTVKEIKPLGEALGMPPLLYAGPPSNQSSTKGSTFGDDLHEVEL